MLTCQFAWAAANDVPPTTTAADPVAMSEDLSQRSDTELTALTAQWGSLSPSERRRLLAEVRGRMAANKEARRPKGVRVQRQYGRVVRKPDGSVVVTQVLRVRPSGTAQIGGADEAGLPRVTFGFGFERRSQSRQQGTPLRQPAVQPQQTPTVTVSQEQPISADR